MFKVLCFILSCLGPLSAVAGECVILLHGLVRSAASMGELQAKLEAGGFTVVNLDYPSREHSIEQLAELALPASFKACEANAARPVNIVTHSLGGILVRQYFQHRSHPDLKRVVMLAPPNQGSEVVDALRDTPGFETINGPAGMQLGTGPEDLPRLLGAVDFELGVIAGTRSVNLLLSTLLPDPDDGKVSVASAGVEGMCALLMLPVTHPFIMSNDRVIAQVMQFLRHGAFSADGATHLPCQAQAGPRSA
ncbi:MAG: alpha/beta fold hydrolase [Pseudomonadota bacterium]